MDASDLYPLRIAREGFWGGNPDQVSQAPTNLVLDVLEFINFQTEYEETAAELNKPTE